MSVLDAPAAPSTRRASDIEPLELLSIVREVTEGSGARFPRRISTRAWDRAASASADHASAPPARRIAEELGLPWSKVVELALLPAAGQRIALGHALNGFQGNWLTPEYVDYALRLVAAYLGVTTLRPGRYRMARREMLARDRARWMHGKRLRLPDEFQIEAVAGSWDLALANSGLAPRDSRGDYRPATGLIALIERCYEHHHAQPTYQELVRFCRANSLALGRFGEGRTWTTWLGEWKQWRRERGLPVPDGPPPLAERPNYDENVQAAKATDRTGNRAWEDHDEVIAHAMRYLQQRPRRERATQRNYADWAAVDGTAPWHSAFELHGGWAAVHEEAQRRLRHGEDPAALLAAAQHRRDEAARQRVRAAEARRANPVRQGRKSAVSLAALVEAGYLLADEELTASRGRWRATFDPQTERVDVIGEGSFPSLTAAALHCSGRPTANGWEFWSVQRDGKPVRLVRLRAAVQTAGGDEASLTLNREQRIRAAPGVA